MTTTSAEHAVTALLDTIAEAWEAGDGDRFASVFTDDADFVNIRALALRGRKEIAEHHNMLFSTIYKGTSIRSEDTRIRLIHPGVATIEQFAIVQIEGEERRAHMLAVAVETPEGWALQALHNMIPFTG